MKQINNPENTGETHLAWITIGLPFGRVEIIDSWIDENHMRIHLGVVLDPDNFYYGSLICLWKQVTFFVISKINDNVLWEEEG